MGAQALFLDDARGREYNGVCVCACMHARVEETELRVGGILGFDAACRVSF